MSYPQWPIWPNGAVTYEDDFTYYSNDMNWFIFSGAEDNFFNAESGQQIYRGVF